MRGAHIENLRPGHWIALIGCSEPPEEGRIREFTGRPMQALEISWPFVCASDGVAVECIDSRRWKMTKVSQKYAIAAISGRLEIPCLKCGKMDVYLKYHEGSLYAECYSCDRCETAKSFYRKARRITEAGQ